MKKRDYERSEIIMAGLILLALILAVFTGARLLTGKRAAQKVAESAAASATPTLVVATPTPTEQQAEAQMTGPRANSGGFMTQTGTSLNLVVNWYAEEAGEEVTVYMDFLLDCSTLHAAARNQGLTVGVGSQTFVFDSAPVEVSEPGAHTVTLYSTCISVPASDFSNDTCPAYATWTFGGSYGGQPIPELTAQGTITLS